MKIGKRLLNQPHPKTFESAPEDSLEGRTVRAVRSEARNRPRYARTERGRRMPVWSKILARCDGSRTPTEDLPGGYHELSVMRDRFHWARLLAFVTGFVNQELLLRNEYLAAENRILRARPSLGSGCRMRSDPPWPRSLSELDAKL